MTTDVIVSVSWLTLSFVCYFLAYYVLHRRIDNLQKQIDVHFQMMEKLQKMIELVNDGHKITFDLIKSLLKPGISIPIVESASVPPGTARFMKDGKCVGEVTNIAEKQT